MTTILHTRRYKSLNVALGIIAAAGLASGCASDNEPPTEVQQVTSTSDAAQTTSHEDNDADETLPTIDAADFEDFTGPAGRRFDFGRPFDAEEARTWATNAGFTTVLVGTEADDVDDMYVGSRIVIELDDEGRATGALVG